MILPDQVREDIANMLLVASDAYYDHRSAGIVPGSGYSHRAEHSAGRIWGWRDSKKFEEAAARVRLFLLEKP